MGLSTMYIYIRRNTHHADAHNISYCLWDSYARLDERNKQKWAQNGTKPPPSAVSLFFIRLNVVLVVAVSAQSALTWQTYWVCGSGSHVEWCWLFIFCLMHLSHPLNLRGDASKSYHLVFLLKGLRGNRTACIEWRDFVGIGTGPTIGNPHSFGP